MPKGSKGWPISIPPRPVGLISKFMGVMAVIVGVIIFLGTVGRDGIWKAGTAGSVFAAGLWVVLVSVIVFYNGHVRYTPSAIMWVPSIGRKRWIALEDVKRVRLENLAVIFDSGRKTRVPLPTKGLAAPTAPVDIRERVLAWLDQQFKPADAVRRKDTWFAVVVSFVWMGTNIAVVRLLKTFPPTSFMTPSIAHNIVQLGAAKWVVIPLVVATAVFLPSCVIWVLARVTAKWFGFNFPTGPVWRYHRDMWEGFEVETPAMLDRPPVPL